VLFLYRAPHSADQTAKTSFLAVEFIDL